MPRPLSWGRREPPLAPVVAVGRGPAARALGVRLGRLEHDALGKLAGVAGAGCLAVTGDDLPWVDGVVYLGIDPLAPRLRLVTTLAPSVHATLLESALLARVRAGPPLAVLHDFTVLSLAEARPVERARLEAWLAS